MRAMLGTVPARRCLQVTPTVQEQRGANYFGELIGRMREAPTG
jgi:hypothetical protein